MRAVWVLVVLAGTIPFGRVHAQQPATADTGNAPWVTTPGAPGRANQALVGDRRVAGVFIERVKFPKGFRGPPHTHTITGYVTILKGELTVGFGAKVDSGRVYRVRAGGFIVLPAGVPHFEWFDEDTIEHVVGVGPMSTSMVDTLGRALPPPTAPARPTPSTTGH